MRGRIRQLKPDIFVDDEFWAFRQQHPELPLFEAFLGLLCQADREGRFEWRPLMLQSQVLPYWRGSFAAALDALAEGGYVVKYEVNGRIYGYVRNFAKHQRPGNREPKSILPPPPEHAQVCSSSALESAQATRASLPQSLPQLPTPNPDPDPLEPEPPESAPVVTVVRKSEPPPRLPPSKRELGEATGAQPVGRFEFRKDWLPKPMHRERGRELGLTEDEMLDRAEDCRRKLYTHPIRSEDDQFFRELTWAARDKETRNARGRVNEHPGADRRREPVFGGHGAGQRE